LKEKTKMLNSKDGITC